MDIGILVSIYISTLLLLAVNVFLITIKKTKIIRVAGILAALSSLIGVGLCITSSGHLPMSGTFEKMQNIVAILLSLGVIYYFIDSKKGFQSFEFIFAAIIFQAIVLFDDLKVDYYFYMYENVSVAGFFQFRLISMAIISFAISLYISALRLKHDNKNRLLIMHRARNFTLLGAIFFLCGEFSGSVWAQIGYGDAWRWSKNFFLSGGMFLLALLGGHLSPKWVNTKAKQAVLPMIPLVVIIILFIT